MQQSRSYLLAATLTLLAACKPAVEVEPDAAGRTYGNLQFQPCTLTSPQASANVAAQCATLEVAEDPAAPQGRKIGLNIAWIAADETGTQRPDPVFFIAGGPGQAASEVASLVNSSLREVRRQRDLFFVDQRGTGKSNPLTCQDEQGKPLPVDPKMEPTIEALTAYAQRCADSLVDRADTRFYTTTDAIADLDAVRAALGVAQINLIGGSYGTRVGQQYAATYPDHTRAVVIDGVAPNELVVGGDFANTFENAITLQSQQCRATPACAKRFPVDTREQLRSLMAQLRQSPVEAEFRDPGTGQMQRETLTAATVASLAFSFSYVPQMSSLLPLVLDEAAQGRYEPLMSLAYMSSRQMGDQINRGMQWSVLCAEDADRYQPPADAGDRLLGPEVAQMFFAACKVWKSGSRPATFNQPFSSSLPVLLLSGELDPVTPPAYAEQVLKTLPNGRHLLARGQGHGTLGVGCMPKLLDQFLESTDAKALDATCLETLVGVPAFTSFNGWEP
jgi:pimeloyl-ACP methyl ester carboxylesterase